MIRYIIKLQNINFLIGCRLLYNKEGMNMLIKRICDIASKLIPEHFSIGMDEETPSAKGYALVSTEEAGEPPPVYTYYGVFTSLTSQFNVRVYDIEPGSFFTRKVNEKSMLGHLEQGCSNQICIFKNYRDAELYVKSTASNYNSDGRYNRGNGGNGGAHNGAFVIYQLQYDDPITDRFKPIYDAISPDQSLHRECAMVEKFEDEIIRSHKAAMLSCQNQYGDTPKGSQMKVVIRKETQTKLRGLSMASGIAVIAKPSLLRYLMSNCNVLYLPINDQEISLGRINSAIFPVIERSETSFRRFCFNEPDHKTLSSLSPRSVLNLDHEQCVKPFPPKPEPKTAPIDIIKSAVGRDRGSVFGDEEMPMPQYSASLGGSTVQNNEDNLKKRKSPSMRKIQSRSSL
jgi:hypothetical protein